MMLEININILFVHSRFDFYKNTFVHLFILFFYFLPYSDHLQLAEDYVTVEVYLQQDID